MSDSSNGNTEFYQSVLKALTADGTMEKFKELLMCEILRAISEGTVDQHSTLETIGVTELTKTESGKICIAVIYNFLKHFKLRCTSAVLRNELGLTSDDMEKNDERYLRKIYIPTGSSDQCALQKIINELMERENFSKTTVHNSTLKNVNPGNHSQTYKLSFKRSGLGSSIVSYHSNFTNNGAHNETMSRVVEEKSPSPPKDEFPNLILKNRRLDADKNYINDVLKTLDLDSPLSKATSRSEDIGEEIVSAVESDERSNDSTSSELNIIF